MSCNTLQDALSSELILNARDLDTLKQLILNGADVNFQSNDGWCLLFELISLDLHTHIDALKDLDINIQDAKGRNALFWAIHHARQKVVEVLLSLGYNTNTFVTSELPALHYAVYKENEAMVALLLKHIDIESKDNYENTALDYAYHYKKKKMITLLTQCGASSANLDY